MPGRRIVAQVLSGNDVFDMKSQIISLLRQPAIFTTIFGSPSNESSCSRIHASRLPAAKNHCSSSRLQNRNKIERLHQLAIFLLLLFRDLA